MARPGPTAVGWLVGLILGVILVFILKGRDYTFGETFSAITIPLFIAGLLAFGASRMSPSVIGKVGSAAVFAVPLALTQDTGKPMAWLITFALVSVVHIGISQFSKQPNSGRAGEDDDENDNEPVARSSGTQQPQPGAPQPAPAPLARRQGRGEARITTTLTTDTAASSTELLRAATDPNLDPATRRAAEIVFNLRLRREAEYDFDAQLPAPSFEESGGDLDDEEERSPRSPVDYPPVVITQAPSLLTRIVRRR